MKSLPIVLVVHNLRSCHNVGSLLRSSDGLGVTKIYFSGYTPYPEHPGDKRLPHIRSKLTRQIKKTALGAEKTTDWEHISQTSALIKQLKQDGYLILALEQTPSSRPLQLFKTNRPVALLLGSEIGGLSTALLKTADTVVEIPMLGQKESLNVAVAAAIAIYHLRSQM